MKADLRRLARDWRAWGVLALLLYTLFGFLVAPWIVKRVAVGMAHDVLGRQLTLRQVRVNPFALSVTVRGADSRDRDGLPLLAFEELYVNLQASGLFRRAWTLRAFNLDGLVAIVRVLPDGSLSIAEYWQEPPPGAAAPPEEPAAIPRLLVHELTLSGGRIEFVDLSRTPPFTALFAPLNLHLAGLSTLPGREGEKQITLGFESGAELSWTGRLTVQPPRLTGRFEASGVPLRRATEYFRTLLPVEVAEGEVRVGAAYTVEFPEAGPTLALTEGEVEVSGLLLRDLEQGPEWVRLESFEARGIVARWPEGTVALERLLLTRPLLTARLEPDGTLDWTRLMDRLGAAKVEAGAAPPAATPAPAEPMRLSAALIEIKEAGLSLEDRTLDPPLTHAITGLAARLEGVSTSSGHPPAHLQASATVNGSAALELSGEGRLAPPEATVEVALSTLDLTAFARYMPRFAHAALTSGALSIRGRGSWSSALGVTRFAGETEVSDLRVADVQGEDLLGWKRLVAREVRLTTPPQEVVIRKIEVTGASGKVLIDRDGQLNLAQVLAVDDPAAAEVGSTPASPAAPLPAVTIAEITLVESGGNFADLSLPIPFAASIHDLSGSLTDVSTRAAAATRLALEGKVVPNGFLKGDGDLRIGDPYADSNVKLSFRGIEMSTLNPYATYFAGYTIATGMLDADLDYRVVERRLAANHRLVASDLTLGDKVEGGDSPGLPLKLAIALLKDKEGKIDVEVPIEGTVDEPEFAYRKLIWTAVKKLLIGVAAAPFRFLGRMLGIEGDELEWVEFEAGGSALIAPEIDKLGKLAGLLRDKPDLTLEIAPRFDTPLDEAALRSAGFEADLAARRKIAPAETGVEPILEAFYAERLTPAGLEDVRARFTPPSATTATPPPAAGTSPAAVPPAAPAFDAAGFYDALREELIASQPLEPGALEALARARAEAIVAVMGGEAGLAPERVVASDPQEAEKKDKKRAGPDWVPCRLVLAAD